ncbi:MAG: DUF3137 domain-containing protein [Phyllobacteriaceae bacterium]|nr:DUF3137 domain-containing protein [Phyllobacteriaceae bacterium]
MAELRAETVMPDSAARAAIDKEIVAYNGEQAVVAASVRNRLPLFVGGALAAAAAVAAFAIQFDPDRDWLSTPMIFVYFFGVMAAFFAWDQAVKPAKLLQQGLRDRILPPLFGFLTDVRYAHGGNPASGDHLPKEAIGSYNRTTIGDLVAGRHDGLDLEIFEATYTLKSSKSSSTQFKGVVLAVSLQHAFPGILVAVRKSGDVTRWFREMFSGKLETIDFANPAVGEAFEVRTSNGEAARKLVDGSLAKALAYLRDEWPDGQPRLALNERSGFVLLPTTKDFFELPKIGTPLHYDGHIAPMSHELARLVALAALVANIR